MNDCKIEIPIIIKVNVEEGYFNLINTTFLNKEDDTVPHNEYIKELLLYGIDVFDNISDKTKKILTTQGTYTITCNWVAETYESYEDIQNDEYLTIIKIEKE